MEDAWLEKAITGEINELAELTSDQLQFLLALSYSQNNHHSLQELEPIGLNYTLIFSAIFHDEVKLALMTQDYAAQLESKFILEALNILVATRQWAPLLLVYEVLPDEAKQGFIDNKLSAALAHEIDNIIEEINQLELPPSLVSASHDRLDEYPNPIQFQYPSPIKPADKEAEDVGFSKLHSSNPI